MNLGKSINNVLKRHAEVKVDGIGVFKRKHTPATFDQSRNAFLPPINYLELDTQGTFGYDFVTYVQRQLQVDRQQAMVIVNQEVEKVKEELLQSGQAKLDDIGYLVNYGNTFVFKPLDLTGFNFEPIKDIEDKMRSFIETEGAKMPISPVKEVVSEEETVVPPIVSPSVSAQSTEEEKIQEEQEEASQIVEAWIPERSKSSGTVWYVVAALVSLGIIGGLYYYWDMQKQHISTPVASIPAQDTSVHLQPLPQPDTVVLMAAVDSAKSDSVRQDSVVQKPVELQPATHEWMIVVGSHAHWNQAEQQVEDLRAKGHKKVYIYESKRSKKWKKVVWKSFKTKEEADIELRQVRESIEPNAFSERIK